MGLKFKAERAQILPRSSFSMSSLKTDLTARSTTTLVAMKRKRRRRKRRRRKKRRRPLSLKRRPRPPPRKRRKVRRRRARRRNDPPGKNVKSVPMEIASDPRVRRKRKTRARKSTAKNSARKRRRAEKAVNRLTPLTLSSTQLVLMCISNVVNIKLDSLSNIVIFPLCFLDFQHS